MVPDNRDDAIDASTVDPLWQSMLDPDARIWTALIGQRMNTLFTFLKDGPKDDFPTGRVSQSSLSTMMGTTESTAAALASFTVADAPASNVLRLPPEIIQQILSYLDVQHLVSLIRTCKHFQTAVHDDILWARLLQSQIPECDFPVSSPYPAASYRQLYLSHHPYWFLPRNRIWFSDQPHVGKLILCKFDSRRGCIEGYRLLSGQNHARRVRWSYKPSVVIHKFTPQVHLWLDDPVLSLPYEIAPSALSPAQEGWQGERKMTVGSSGHSTSAAFFLSKDIPERAQFPGMSLWPPRTIPGMPRVRAESLDKFQSKGHRPDKLKDISQTTFRMRHWTQFSTGLATFGVKIGEEVSTWSTLDPNLYTPTEDKPYQGIFVGDYADHGCEFLLVMQTDTAPSQPESQVPSDYLALILQAMEDEVDHEDDANPSQESNATNTEQSVQPNVQNDKAHRGAIEAVKLTGDPHVPRGEHTFIADDISNAGLIRIAAEAPFRGARVVKSRGHVAGRGFQNGMPSLKYVNVLQLLTIT